MPTSTNFGYLLYATPVTTMPPECAFPKPDFTSETQPESDTAAYSYASNPTPVTSSEIVSPDSTFAIYEEALAETRTVVRDEAKAILKQRIREVEQIRTTLARAEEELAKILKKTPEEIASIRTFGPSDKNMRRLMGMS